MKNKISIKIVLMFMFFNSTCSFFEENKPIQPPGLGIEIKDNSYQIHFDVGILTFENYEISRDKIEHLFNQAIEELEKKWKNIKLNPVFDQPQDAPFLMERVVSKRLNPYIATFRLKKKFLYHNNFIIEEVLEEDANKIAEKYFLSSQLHHFLYSQVRYDILIIPFPILSDFDYNNQRKEKEIHFLELGVAKGRTALDKLGLIIYIDYKNLDSPQNIQNLKLGLISFIMALPVDISNKFLDYLCKECNDYMTIRNHIFDLYYNFNKGKKPIGCKNLAKDWIAWQVHPFIENHNKIIKKQLTENFEALKKQCKN